MDKLSEVNILHKELMNEYIETISNMNKEKQEQLWNILNAKHLTIKQKKQLFLEPVNTSRYYKISQIIN